MENKKRIFVTGVTGNQGGAVAQHLINNGHAVIGLTRNANSEKAQQLQSQGLTLVEGNLKDPSPFLPTIKGVDAIFFVQSLQAKSTEIAQGKQFINAVKSIGIPHFVYASVLGADLNTGVPHFESKLEIEQHLKASAIPYTILRPASFYENFLIPQVANGIKKGNYMTPLNTNCRQQMIGTDAIGKIALQVISNPTTYFGKTLSIATDEYQIGDVPQLFAEAMNKPVTYKKLPGIIVRFAMGKDLYKMFRYMNQNDFCVVDDIQNIRDEFGIEGGFKDWIHQHFSA